MHTKTIGILLCILIITCGTITVTSISELPRTTPQTHIFILGRMEQLDFHGDSIDFKVLSIAFIKQGKDLYTLSQGDQVKLLAPMLGMLLGRTVFGFFGDWELIQ